MEMDSLTEEAKQHRQSYVERKKKLSSNTKIFGEIHTTDHPTNTEEYRQAYQSVLPGSISTCADQVTFLFGCNLFFFFNISN